MSKMTLFKKAGLRNCCSSYYLVLLRLVMNASGVYIPPDSIPDSNLGFGITFTILSASLVGIVVLPVVLLKSLRSQPYQFLVSNYLTSSLANVLGSGIYRIIQIIRYKAVGYEAAARGTNCIITSFSTFPFVVSNYCLFLIGLERFIYLRSKPRIPVDWYSLFVFIITPWALGITRYSVILGDSSSRYINIPYSGLCIDITPERDGRRIVHFIFDIVVPVLLAIITLSLAIARTYSDYNEITAKLSYDLQDERLQLEKEKRQVLKVIKELYLPITFLVLKLVSIVVITLLFREVGNEENTQQQKDSTATAGMNLLLFEPCLISVVFFVLNFDLRRQTLRYIPGFRSSVSPDPLEDTRDQVESDDARSESSGEGSNVAEQPPDITTAV